MSCDLTSGRLLDECLVGRAGIKTLYFAKFNDYNSLTGVTESGGEITSLGADPIVLYQFDIGASVGSFEETPTVSKENGVSFITQVVNLSLYNIQPSELSDLNNMKRGRWVVWALDYESKIRLFGQTRGLVSTGGSDTSGTAAGDKKGLDMTFEGFANNYAPFMADYTTTPFDNFTNVRVKSEDTYPSVLDNDTVLWLDFAETYVTKDGSNRVSFWADRSINGNDLTQAVTGQQPTWSSDGILFDAIDDFMSNVGFTLGQPIMIYAVLRQITWVRYNRFWEGDVSNGGVVYQTPSSPDITAYSGILSTPSPNLVLNTFGIIRVKFNGASSTFQIDDNSQIAGNFGTNDMNGIWLGSGRNGTSLWSNIEVKELIFRDIADSGVDEAEIYAYLKSKHGL